MEGNHFSIVKRQPEVTVPWVMFSNSRENSTHSPCWWSYCRSELLNLHLCWDTMVSLWRNNSVHSSLSRRMKLEEFYRDDARTNAFWGKTIEFFRNPSCSLLTVLHQWVICGRRQTSKWISKVREGQIHALMHRFDLALQMFYHSVGSFH